MFPASHKLLRSGVFFMWRALGAVLAATAGTAFLSGRQLTLFFSQLGGMSWLAVGTASALFGLCCGALSRFARQMGGENVAAVLMRRLDPRTGAAVGVAHGLLRAALAGIMLCVAGHMAALLWMAKNAFWMGAAGALLTAALLRMGRGRAALGWMVLALGAAFYLALALDGREVQYATRYEVTLLWRGSAPAALALGLLSACMSTALSAGVAVRACTGRTGPWGFGLFCALLFLLVNLAGNAALRCRCDEILSLRTPFAALAAQWGTTGFFICAGMTFLGASVALAGVFLSLLRRKNGRCGARRDVKF